MKIFLDSSVLIAAFLSPEGGSAQILEFCEAGLLQGNISRDVIREIEEVVARKLPEIRSKIQKIIRFSALKIIGKIRPALLKKSKGWIADPGDAKILAAAKQNDVQYLITLDLRHFIKDPRVAEKSGLKILTPGDFLKMFRLLIN